ncbi:MAG: hypothetical protein LUF80_00630 [Oscillospiraceae bacterium]|nr:hypothetical protein [Oscillospiraceae bacterium]
MKLFISQPMLGKTDEEILEERAKAVQDAGEYFPVDANSNGERVEIVDSFFDDNDSNPLSLLGRSVQLLSTADVAYFAKGWANARGCRIEHTCAVEYGIPTIEDHST